MDVNVIKNVNKLLSIGGIQVLLKWSVLVAILLNIYIYMYFKMFLAGNDSCSLRLEFDITELNSFE